MRECPIVIHDKVFPADLVLLEIQGYDVILGIDWLTKHKATIDCEQKLLTLVTPEGERLVHKGINPKQGISLISTTRAFKLLKKGHLAYLCAVEAIETQGPDPKEIFVV